MHAYYTYWHLLIRLSIASVAQCHERFFLHAHHAQQQLRFVLSVHQRFMMASGGFSPSAMHGTTGLYIQKQQSCWLAAVVRYCFTLPLVYIGGCLDIHALLACSEPDRAVLHY